MQENTDDFMNRSTIRCLMRALMLLVMALSFGARSGQGDSGKGVVIDTGNDASQNSQQGVKSILQWVESLPNWEEATGQISNFRGWERDWSPCEEGRIWSGIMCQDGVLIQMYVNLRC